MVVTHVYCVGSVDGSNSCVGSEDGINSCVGSVDGTYV